jgi:hypothetical protein
MKNFALVHVPDARRGGLEKQRLSQGFVRKTLEPLRGKVKIKCLTEKIGTEGPQPSVALAGTASKQTHRWSIETNGNRRGCVECNPRAMGRTPPRGSRAIDMPGARHAQVRVEAAFVVKVDE